VQGVEDAVGGEDVDVESLPVGFFAGIRVVAPDVQGDGERLRRHGGLGGGFDDIVRHGCS